MSCGRWLPGSGRELCRTDLLVRAWSNADSEPAPRVFVRFTIAGDYTVAGGAFAIEDLAPHEYRLEIAMSPTGGTLSARDVTADQLFIAVAAPIP